MLRFVLAIVIMAVLLKLTHENPYVGFGIWLFLSVFFMIHTMNTVNCKDNEFEKRMLRTAENRRRYYEMINSNRYPLS